MVISLFEEFSRLYQKRTPRSAQLYERARRCAPLGVHSDFRYFEPYPFYVAQARGSRVYDADGNEYIDFCMGFGALLVGHAHPKIVEALGRALEDGTMYTMPHEREIQLAEEILRRYPMLDQVRFVNTGTEATMHALRLARAYTGREGLIKMAGGYHGMYDVVLVWEGDAQGRPIPFSEGVSKKALEDLHIATFNDLDSVERIFREHPGEIAAVITEPVLMNVGIVPPQPGFLQELTALCHRYGALLIFDEVKTGAKLAPGGACEYFGVEPDIVCLAKAIGGGLPLGAFGTRAEIMELIAQHRVRQAGTYSGNPLSVTAGLVALTEILTPEVYPRLCQLNEQLVQGYNEIIDSYELAAYAVGIGPCGNVYFFDEKAKGRSRQELQETLGKNHQVLDYVDVERTKTFWLGMLNAGIIPYPRTEYSAEQWMISVQHTEEDIVRNLEAFEGVAAALAESFSH